jgi:DNA polymerase elongation subunit (family B)
MAEAITTSGQLSILYAEKAMNKEMNKILQTDGQDFVIAIDTDSLYINFEQLVAKIDPPDPVDFLDRICGEHFETVLGNDYKHLARVTGSRTNRMEMEREVIADRAIWIAKKRYILNVHNNEGVQYDEPKLKIMGIEAIKSSTPEVCRQMFKQAFEIIMKGSEEETQSFLAKWKAEHKSMTPEQISSPRGVSNITKWHDPYTTFTKGTPIHVRGALVYNKSISEEGLGNQYDLIKNGEKIKFVYLKVPNHVRQDVVSFPNVLPKELDLARFIDYNKMYTKTFGNAMDNILNAIGWTSEPKSTLDAFFG